MRAQARRPVRCARASAAGRSSRASRTLVALLALASSAAGAAAVRRAPGPLAGYPPGADVAVLTSDGSAVGPLYRLRVRGKYTAFDVYAEWCAPCRVVDARLREIVAQRKDVAVRKLNVVNFDTPLARELGPRFDSLPYVVVFGPDGRRTEIMGADIPRLDAALGMP